MLVIYTPRARADAVDLARSLTEISRKSGKPIIAAWMGERRAAEGRRILLEADLPAYATPEEAVKTYLYMYRYKRNIELLYETPAEVGQAARPSEQSESDYQERNKGEKVSLGHGTRPRPPDELPDPDGAGSGGHPREPYCGGGAADGSSLIADAE